MKFLLSLFVLLTLIAANVAPVFALSVPTLIKDVNVSTISSQITSIVSMGGSLYFAANNSQIWKSDGTLEGTVLVKDIYPGMNARAIGEFFVDGDTFYFSGNSGVNGTEIWKSDGTTDGTVMVKDVRLGQASATNLLDQDNSVGVLNNEIFFAAFDDSGVGSELYKTDGTAEGTILVKEIRPGAGGSVPSSFTRAGGQLFFSAFTDSSGWELYKTDGTTVGTQIVKDLKTGGDGLNQYFSAVEYNGELFFGGTTDAAGYELMKSDGTSVGTVVVKDINVGTGSSALSRLAVSGSNLFFVSDDGVNGFELWKTDGTEEGTVMVKNIAPGGTSSSPDNLVDIDGVLYFTASDDVSGVELWKTDGTEEGTVMVKDIASGDTNSSPRNLVNIDGVLYFAADDGVNGTELWKTDGTDEGTVMVRNILPNTHPSQGSNPRKSKLFGGQVYFIAYSELYGDELWKSDGTSGGTLMVKDVNTSTQSSVDVDETMSFNGAIFYAANDGVHGFELWKTDGTSSGTVMVKDVNSGYEDSLPRNFTTLGDSLYFITSNSEGQYSLWKTDGTTNGTVFLQTIGETTLVRYGNDLYIQIFDETYGAELGVVDGNSGEVRLFKDINIGSSDSAPGTFTVWNGSLYFTAVTDAAGEELWKTDGTEEGTVMVKDINSGASNSAPQSFYGVGQKLYFVAHDNTHGFELWKTDGTEEGTVMVKDINLGSGNSMVNPNLISMEGRVYFGANDGVNGEELWKTDGTEEGTVMVKNINLQTYNFNLSTGSSVPYGFFVFKGNLYFSADDGVNGRELWKTNGATDGTVLIKDISNGSTDSDPGVFVAAGKDLYFRASDSGSGDELWKTDGTADGTDLVADIYTGAFGSSPNGLQLIGNKLFFFAQTSLFGNEAYVLTVDLNESVASVSTPIPPPSNGPIVISSGGGGGFAMPGTVKNYIVPNQQTVTPTTQTPGQTPTFAPTNTVTSYSRNLSVGARGEDVRNLQKLLNSLGFTIAKTGPGSPGNETNYYGTLTAAAVKRLQEANREMILSPFGLSSGTGFFGPATRKYLEGLRF